MNRAMIEAFRCVTYTFRSQRLTVDLTSLFLVIYPLVCMGASMGFVMNFPSRYAACCTGAILICCLGALWHSTPYYIDIQNLSNAFAKELNGNISPAALIDWAQSDFIMNPAVIQSSNSGIYLIATGLFCILAASYTENKLKKSHIYTPIYKSFGVIAIFVGLNMVLDPVRIEKVRERISDALEGCRK